MTAHPRRPDLHCHSNISDGTHAPAWLAQRAHSRGVDLWALTDHDEVGGVAEAAATARTLGLPFLPGVEISVTWEEKTIHIVGLGIDENHAGLLQGLQQTRAGRVQRGQAMAAQLEARGIQGAWEGALKYVGNPELVARPHLARYLVETGVCRSVGEVFLHYLKEGKPGFVPHQWASLPDALQWIHAAGGMAVVAHPARYAFTPQQEQAFYSGEIAPFFRKLTQAFTNVLFTEREIGHGNRIIFAANSVQFATLPEKVTAAKFLTEIGAATLDQILTMFDMPTIGGEEGARRVQTLNMVNAKLADKYQTGADGETPPDDPKKEKDPPPAEPDGGEAKEA